MTRVHHVVWAYPSAAEPYAGPFFRTQAEALARLGLDVHVTAPVPWANGMLARLSDRWRVYCEVPREQFAEGVHVDWPRYVVPPKSELLAVAHYLMSPLIRRVLRSAPALLHAHGAYPLGLCCARHAGTALPTVLTVHGGDINVLPDVSRRLRGHIVSAVRGATRVIAVSAALARKTESLTGILPEVLPLGVDVQRFRPVVAEEKAAMRRALGLRSDKRLVLYVGSLYHSKGIPELCDVLADLACDGVQGVFVGDGPLRPAVMATPGAVQVGRIANDDVRRYMVASDLLVLPSHTEGLPTVLVEAGMVGLPVVATAVGGIPELLGRDRGAMVKPLHSLDLRDAIRRVLARPEGAEAMAARLQEYVRRSYNATKNAVRLAEIYSELLSAHHGMHLHATAGT